jgi:hypothetical protein
MIADVSEKVRQGEAGMMRFASKRVSSAHVIALVALFVALGGGAYAAGLGKNSVGAKQFRKGAVRSAEIKNGAVKRADLAPALLRGGGGAPQPPAPPGGGGGGGGGGVGLPAAHVIRASAQVGVNTLGAELSSADSILQATLPSGNWVVQAQATFGPNAATERVIACTLLDGNNPLSNANAHTQAATTFSATASLVGASDGGLVHLACAGVGGGAQARDRTIVATQVGTVTGP